MTLTHALLVITISIVVCMVTESDEKLWYDEVKSARLHRVHRNPQKEDEDLFRMGPTQRREKCNEVASKIAESIIGLVLPPSNNKYYVPEAQNYRFDNEYLVAIRCPTFPALYVGALDNIRILNPYQDHEFEFESALRAEEVELPKKDKKDKKDKKKKDAEKTPKEPVDVEPSKEKEKEIEKEEKKEKDKEEMKDEKKSKENKDEEEDEDKKESKSKKKKDKVEDEHGAEEKPKKEKDKEEDEGEEKPKTEKDKEKKKGNQKIQEQYLSFKMINIDAEKRWLLCHTAKRLIYNSDDQNTYVYTANNDPKIYKFSYVVQPAEIDIAFQCFTKPELYIRVSRSDPENVFMISLVGEI